MITIEGKSLKPGVAIATAAVVDAKQGMGGVSPALLMEGVKALRAMSSARDYPEAVIACDMLALGMSLRLPGVATVGIAAESDAEVPGLEPQVPCVIGLTDLIKSISEGDVLIVDGNQGAVYIDPDLQTLLHYQEMEERAAHEHVVYIAAEHLPAKTAGGETVTVMAVVESEAGLTAALEQGADGIIADTRASAISPAALLRGSPGKPVVFLADTHTAELAQAIEDYAVPGQVTVLHPKGECESAPHVAPWPVFRAVFDINESADSDMCGAIVLIGALLDAIEHVVECGARAVAVEPELVAAAKDTIRSIGLEDEE